jgi:kynurenine 3-monooxygenase
MNAGFEDCYELIALLQKNKYDSWNELLDTFQENRKKNCDAIADLALLNFVEMRDKVADERFLLRKKIEARIHQKYPAYLPLYTMVTFSDLPYAEALKIGKFQDKLMEKIMKIPDIESIWNGEELWERAGKLLNDFFTGIKSNL